METKFTFWIKGSYSPATIPLERLGEYLAALGQLFGEQAHVHFSKLTKGSTIIHARVEHEAAPKVEKRVRRISLGDAPEKVVKAYEKLDQMLRDDNATGSLSGGTDNVIHVDFRGCTKPEPLTYGPVKQSGVIDGEVFRVEGRDATVHVGVMDGDRTYSLEAPATMAKQLAVLFRAGVFRFRGEGTWLREGPGTWELRRFKIDAVEPLSGEPLSETIADLRRIGVGDWAKLEDPIRHLLNERGEGGTEH